MKDFFKTDNIREFTRVDPTEKSENFDFNFKLYKSLIIHDYKKRAIQKQRPQTIEQFAINRLTFKERPADSSALVMTKDFDHGKAQNSEKNKVRNKKRHFQGCSHLERKHYAKGMCKDCYGKIGRQKLAIQCAHTDKKNYALGMCNTCYYKFYNQRLRYHRADLVQDTDEVATE